MKTSPLFLLHLAAAGIAGIAAAAEKPVRDRIADRDFPSIHLAWSSADNLADREDKITTMARHDILWLPVTDTGLLWNNDLNEGLATAFQPASIQTAKTLRRGLLEKNPNLVMLGELRFRDAWSEFLPADHPWWKRTPEGAYDYGWKEGGYIKLDYANPELRRHLAAQARAVVQSGVFDGIFLDWWADDDDRVALLEALREGVGPEAIIVANVNWHKAPRSAPYLNGLFMECSRNYTRWQWEAFQDTLQWAEQSLREPHANCFETWWQNSRRDLRMMRATSTFSLVFSDGYCLFADPNELPSFDHLHDWYPFWDEPLGTPRGAGAKQEDGAGAGSSAGEPSSTTRCTTTPTSA